MWAKTFGGTSNDYGYFVQQTLDGGCIITGWTYNFGVGDANIYLIKTGSNGDTLWTKTFGGTNDDKAYSVQQTTDSGYIITGISESSGAGSSDVYLIKTDSNGNDIWTKTFGTINYERGYSVKQTTDGGYIIAGMSSIFSAADNDVYLLKIDANGDFLWSKMLGGTNNDLGTSVQQTGDGGYIVAGSTNSFGTGDNDVYLIKSGSNGDTLWTKIFGGIDGDYGIFVNQTADGGYMIAGSTLSSGAGHFDIYLIKTDANGNSGCNQGNTTTLITSPPTQETSPATIVTAPATIVSSPATIVGSGGIVTTLCSTVGINEITTDNLFFISPNPFTSEISITFQNQNLNQATISIKNILGQTVFEKVLRLPASDLTTKLDLNFLSQGIYLLEVNTDGERMVRKVVKE